MPTPLTLKIQRIAITNEPGYNPVEKVSTKKVVVTKKLKEGVWAVKIGPKIYGLFKHKTGDWTIRGSGRRPAKWLVLDDIDESKLPQEATGMTRIRGGTPYKDKLPGGVGDDKIPSDFDQDQLKKGVKVELEHGKNDPLLALEIAIDHLTEDPRYYDYLDEMEKKFDNSPDAPGDSEGQFGPPPGGRGLGPGGGDPSKCPFRNEHADDIVRLLQENPEPNDEQIHQLAEQLGIEHEDLEEEVYRMLGRLLAVRPKGSDNRVFVEGDDPAEFLAELALSLYERGDEKLGDDVTAVLNSWR